MNTGIYAITGPSGREYIGSAVNFESRWRVHRSHLRRGMHHSPALQRAWDKYGEENMRFRKLLVCNRADLLMYEQRSIDILKPRYNASPTAGSRMGMRHSEQAKVLVSEAATRQWADSKNRAEQSMRKLEFHRLNPTAGREHSGRMTKIWGNAEARIAQSERLVAYWNDPSARAKQSVRSRLFHDKNPKFSVDLSESMRGNRIRSKKVMCIDLNMTFDSIRHCLTWLRTLGHTKAGTSSISAACSGKQKSAYGYQWAYAAQANPLKKVPLLNGAELAPASANPKL